MTVSKQRPLSHDHCREEEGAFLLWNADEGERRNMVQLALHDVSKNDKCHHETLS